MKKSMRQFNDVQRQLALTMLRFFQQPRFIREMYRELEPQFPTLRRDQVRAVSDRLRTHGYLQRRAGGTRDLVLATTGKGRTAINKLETGKKL